MVAEKTAKNFRGLLYFAAPCRWACHRIKFLDRHRGFTCVLFKMWQVAAVKFRQPFNCCRHCWLTLMFQATQAVSRPSRLEGRGRELGGQPATNLPDGRTNGCARGGRPTGQPCGLAQRNEASIRLGALLNTVQGSLLPTYHAHTQTHTHTHALRVAQWA